MHYQITICPLLCEQIRSTWNLKANTEILEITAFGDFFVRNHHGCIELYSLTDGEILDVTELVTEYGLPPVNLDLGDEWYQLSTQNALKEEHKELNAQQCFSFITPLFKGGIYGPDNITIEPIEQYHQRLKPLLATKTP